MAGTLRVVVSARKGGVGKSAVTALVARHLASQGAKVLVLDLDPQRTSSSGRLGADIESPLPYTAVDLVKGPQGRGFLPQVIIPGHLDVVAANQRDVIELEAQLRAIHKQREQSLGPSARRAALDARLTAVEVGYDFVIIDTPTYFGEITTNALEAAHIVLSPFNTKALDDTDSVLDILDHMAELSRKAPVYFLPNLWDSRKRDCKASLERAMCLVPGRVLSDMILPELSEVVRAMREHRNVLAKDETSAVLAERLWKLGQLLMERRADLQGSVGGA